MNKSFFLSAVFATVVAISSVPDAAQAQGMNARSITDGCRAWMAIESGQDEPPNLTQEQVLAGIFQAGQCHGYIQGFLSGVSFGSYGSQAENSRMFCVPEGVTSQQIARVAIKFIDDHPRFEHTDALPFMIGIMASNFPCQK